MHSHEDFHVTEGAIYLCAYLKGNEVIIAIQGNGRLYLIIQMLTKINDISDYKVFYSPFGVPYLCQNNSVRVHHFFLENSATESTRPRRFS